MFAYYIALKNFRNKFIYFNFLFLRTSNIERFFLNILEEQTKINHFYECYRRCSVKCCREVQMNAVLILMEEFLASVSLTKRQQVVAQQVVATLTKEYTA